MAISIKDEGVDKLIRQLAVLTGESYTAAVGEAVKERMEKIAALREGLRQERNRKIAGFMKGRKPVRLRGGKTTKQARNTLWEP